MVYESERMNMIILWWCWWWMIIYKRLSLMMMLLLFDNFFFVCFVFSMPGVIIAMIMIIEIFSFLRSELNVYVYIFFLFDRCDLDAQTRHQWMYIFFFGVFLNHHVQFILIHKLTEKKDSLSLEICFVPPVKSFHHH